MRWFLSIDRGDLPESLRAQGRSTFRSLAIGSDEIEFSNGFADLHTAVYREILAGRGFGIDDARPSIEMVHQIRTAAPMHGNSDSMHPLALRAIERDA